MYRTHEPCLRKPVFAYMYVKTKGADQLSTHTGRSAHLLEI